MVYMSVVTDVSKRPKKKMPRGLFMACAALGYIAAHPGKPVYEIAMHFQEDDAGDLQFDMDYLQKLLTDCGKRNLVIRTRGQCGGTKISKHPIFLGDVEAVACDSGCKLLPKDIPAGEGRELLERARQIMDDAQVAFGGVKLIS